MPSYSLESYLQAAERENTQRSYASALRHFEVTWGGLLPATTQSVTQQERGQVHLLTCAIGQLPRGATLKDDTGEASSGRS